MPKHKVAKEVTKMLQRQKDFLEEVLGWIASGEIKVCDLPPVLVRKTETQKVVSESSSVKGITHANQYIPEN